MHFQFFIYSSLHERQENCTILTWQNPPSDKIQNRSIVGSIFSFTNLFLFFSFFFSFHHFYIPQNSKMLQNMKAQYQKVIEFELWTLSSRCGYSACQKAFFFSLLACIIKINGSLCCTGSLHGYISSPLSLLESFYINGSNFGCSIAHHQQLALHIFPVRRNWHCRPSYSHRTQVSARRKES